jgi:hypothetical protein
MKERGEKLFNINFIKNLTLNLRCKILLSPLRHSFFLPSLFSPFSFMDHNVRRGEGKE